MGNVVQEEFVVQLSQQGITPCSFLHRCIKLVLLCDHANASLHLHYCCWMLGRSEKRNLCQWCSKKWWVLSTVLRGGCQVGDYSSKICTLESMLFLLLYKKISHHWEQRNNSWTCLIKAQGNQGKCGNGWGWAKACCLWRKKWFLKAKYVKINSLALKAQTFLFSVILLVMKSAKMFRF